MNGMNTGIFIATFTNTMAHNMCKPCWKKKEYKGYACISYEKD